MSENTKKVNVEKEEGKKVISEKNLALIITAAVLAVIFIVTAVISLVQAVQRDVWFDYLNSDLDSYLEFDKDYKNFKIDVDIAKPHDIDVDVTILNLIYEDKSEKPLYGGSPVTSPITITAGDTVNIWFRGYLLDEDGNQISVDGMSNFTDSSSTAIGIGANNFVPGFELNLIGKNTGDYSKFEKIIKGALKDSMIAYVNYSIPSEKDSSKLDSFKGVRMDLSTDLDAKYGAGFKAELMKLAIGDKGKITATLGEKSVTYSDVTVTFATECETNPMIVECYFPYDYSKTELRNETAYFEVYVDGVIVYDCPEFNDEYLTKKIEDKEINLTLEELNEYEGATLVEKYRKFVQKTLDDIYDSSYASLVEQKIWDYYSSIVKVKKYPMIKVEEMYDQYIDELTTQYITYGGQAYDSTTGQYKTYDTLEGFIPAYLGLSANTKWQDYITDMAKNAVKERMTMYYLLKAENLMPTEEVFNEKLESIRQEYLDQYIAQYLNYEGKTKEDYTDEEYAELVEDCTEEIFSYYDDDYFAVRVYYTVVSETFIDWPEVVTLDERRAYPLDK